MGGAGIFRIQNTDHNIGVIIETLTRYGTRTIMAQRFLPEIREGDKRILLIAGRPVDYALARIPKLGKHAATWQPAGRVWHDRYQPVTGKLPKNWDRYSMRVA